MERDTVMRFGNDDQAGQAEIEQNQAARRRRIQLRLNSTRQVYATVTKLRNRLDEPGPVLSAPRDELIDWIIDAEKRLVSRETSNRGVD